MLSRRVLPVVTIAALALTVAGCGGTSPDNRARDAQSAVAHPLFWAGPSFAGLKVSAIVRQAKLTSFEYGTCKASGDSGCAPPLEIQTASICDRNEHLLDVKPKTRFRSRGVVVLDYGDGRLELASGGSQVVIWASPALGRRVLAALRPVRDGRRLRPLLPVAVPCRTG